MNIIYPGYSFRGALFAIFTGIAVVACWIVTLLTLGWVGRYWSIRVHYYTLGHRYNVVYREELQDTTENSP
jgi:hypothetical protein